MSELWDAHPVAVEAMLIRSPPESFRSRRGEPSAGGIRAKRVDVACESAAKVVVTGACVKRLASSDFGTGEPSRLLPKAPGATFAARAATCWESVS